MKRMKKIKITGGTITGILRYFINEEYINDQYINQCKRSFINRILKRVYTHWYIKDLSINFYINLQI